MGFNRDKIIDDISKVSVDTNESGIIEGFGVFLNQLPAHFWTEFSDRILNSVSGDLEDTAKYLLYNAANECGYHTGYGIVNSEEWDSIVKPHLDGTPESVLHGALALFTGWGWGKAEIVELVPSQRMVVRAYDYYESDVVAAGKSTSGLAPMIAGVCAAFMDLAYSAPYPKGLGGFQCEQTKGLECGDEYGEFVVTKMAA